MKCWGENEEGQLGVGDTKTRGNTKKQMGDALPFVAFPQDVDIVAIDAEDRRSCALDSSGKLWCWGGDGLAPVDLPRKVESFSLGAMHSCALLEGGAVRCWGTKGPEIGLGDVALGDDLRAIHVAAGMTHTCVLFGNAKIKCFGEGMYGVLGVGDTRTRGDDAKDMGNALPWVDLGNFRAVELVAGGLHACARAVDNRVKCWGNNHSGQLGLGHHEGPGGKPGQSRAAPPVGDARPSVDLGQGTAIVSLATGNTDTCAVVDRGRAPDGSLDHTITCWPKRNDEFVRLDPGPELVPMAIAPGGLGGCAIVVERARTIEAPPMTGRVTCWGAWVPGKGVGSAAIGVPEADRRESLAPSPPLVDLGKDVRVVIP